MKYLSRTYCIYITFYKGNLMPPFYIGKSFVERINNGYHGSVNSMKYKSIWLKELKNNPRLFKTIILKTFDDERDALLSEEKIHIQFDVARNPMFINMANSNKFFYTEITNEYRQLCRERMLKFKHTNESKEKISKAHKGKRLTNENKNKLKKAWSSNPDRKKTLANMASQIGTKEIIQYSLNGDKIATYESISKAAKICGLKISAISNCLNGRSKMSGGYVWKFKE